MKKTLLVLLGASVGVIGMLMVQQNQRARAEADLWAEATDPLGPQERS